MTATSGNNLRDRLEEIFEAQSWPEYLSLFAAVTRDCPNGIVLLESPHPVERYTCVVHILDFTGRPQFVQIASRGFNVIAGPNFVEWLVERGLLSEIIGPAPQKGDLIIYFSRDGKAKHAGLALGNGRVESKWGKGGLFQHGVNEVPASYGSITRFFRKLPWEEALEYFKAYLTDKRILLFE